MTLKIRPAHPGDADALTDIMRRSNSFRDKDSSTIDAFRSSFRNSPSGYDFLVAECHGKPVGFIGGKLDKVPGDDTQTPYLIGYLHVAPEESRKGFGRLLLTRMSDLARANGADRLKLEIDPFARAFYEDAGFVAPPERPGHLPPGKHLPVMEKLLDAGITPLTGIDIRFEAGKTWAFEDQNRAPIETHWAQLTSANPHLWNGRTLKLTSYDFQAGRLTGTCRECSYAAFLSWRDWGAPDMESFNLFGSSILVSSDGAILYGVMAPHTATAGHIYPPGGNLDPSDIRSDGTVDVLGSSLRELHEETGLTEEDLSIGNRFAVFDGPRISIATIVQVSRPAEVLRQDILRFSKASEEQELSDIYIIRGSKDLKNPAIMPYARALAALLLEGTERVP